MSFHRHTLVIAVAFGFLFPAPSSADAVPSVFTEVRSWLTQYDLSEEGTIRVLEVLGHRERSERDAARRRELRYLRAAAAVDLLILARMTGDVPTAVRVAQAYGAPADELERRLRADLESVGQGIFRDGAADLVGALAALETQQVARLPSAASPGQQRSAAIAVVRIADELVVDAGDPIAVLARVGEDRCAGGRNRAECTAELAAVEAPARRAIDALVKLQARTAVLIEAGQNGDPFARFLRERLEGAQAVFEDVSIRPRIVLDSPESFVLAAAVENESAAADMLVVVGENTVRIGHLPRLRVRREAVVDEAPEPRFSEAATVHIPSEWRPVVRSIPDVVDALGAIDGVEGRAVVIAAAMDTPAHVVSRVWASARRARMVPAGIAIADEAGTLRMLPVVPADETPLGGRDAELFIRLGGYTVRQAGRVDDLARVREPDGFRFDVAALRGRFQASPPERVLATFMADVEWSVVAEAIVTAGRASRVMFE